MKQIFKIIKKGLIILNSRLDEMRRIVSIGNTAELKTTTKNDLVEAVNEIKEESDLKIACVDYGTDTSVIIPTGGGKGGAITPVGLMFKWVGTKLGIKRENAYGYTFSDLAGAPGKQGDAGMSGRPGDRGSKGEPGFPTRKDWKAMMSRLELLERENNVVPLYPEGEFTYIANIITDTNKLANIIYRLKTSGELMKHELSIDGGITFQEEVPENINDYYKISKTLLDSTGVLKCVVRVSDTMGQYNYSNIFTIDMTPVLETPPFKFELHDVIYNVKTIEKLFIKYKCNRNIKSILLSIDDGETFLYQGSLVADRVSFILGSIPGPLYNCKLKVETFTTPNNTSNYTTEVFNVRLLSGENDYPFGTKISVNVVQPLCVPGVDGKPVKNKLTILFKVNEEAADQVRFMYYDVDDYGMSPISKVRYMGGGIFESEIPWILDPYTTRKVTVTCARLINGAIQNNISSMSATFVQDYSANIVDTSEQI